MENWKPIPGYEGIYDASDCGRVRSTPGKTTSNARYSTRKWKTRVLKPKHPVAGNRHDLRVTLWKDGLRKDALVSRLVAAAWLGSPEDGMTVNHKNGDYLDNRPVNLEWVSIADNIKHGFENGLFSAIQKPVVLEDKDGNRCTFRSMSEADRFLNRSTGYLSNALKKGRSIKDRGGRVYFVKEVGASA